MHGATSPTVTFITQTNRSTPSSSIMVILVVEVTQKTLIGGYLGAHGHGRCPHHCQLCCKDGRYVNLCPDLPNFSNWESSINSNLA